MIPWVWGESYRTSSYGTTEPSASNISSRVEQMDKTSYGATHWLADLQLLLGQTRNSFPQDALVVLKNRRHKARNAGEDNFTLAKAVEAKVVPSDSHGAVQTTFPTKAQPRVASRFRHTGHVRLSVFTTAPSRLNQATSRLRDGSQFRAQAVPKEVVVSERRKPHIPAHVHQTRPRDVVHRQLVLRGGERNVQHPYRSMSEHFDKKRVRAPETQASQPFTRFLAGNG